MASLGAVDCTHCAFPNPAWKRRCGRCDGPLHSIVVHLAVWVIGAIVSVSVALLLLAPS